MTELVPSLLVRRFLPKPWGGRALSEVLGIELPEGEAIGETWELYDRPDGSSPLEDRDATLHDWVERDPEALLGRGVAPTPSGHFPLLLKFIDARRALSVQVHPDRDQARRQGDEAKSEAWIILDVGEKARIVRGFRADVTREQVESALGRPEIEDLLHHFVPRAGDVVPVPPGTVHAIGADVVLFEVQQNSDITYRLYDYGSSRELHLEDAREALRVDGTGPARIAPQEIDDTSAWLLRTPHFRVRRLCIERPTRLETEGSFKVLTCLRGGALVEWKGPEGSLVAAPGDNAIVPACTEAIQLTPESVCDMLWTDPGSGASA